MDSINASDIIVYTAIFGDYDILRDPQNHNPDCRYVCFTDSPQDSDVWEVITQRRFMSTPVLDARLRKILVHKVLNTRYSIWLDGNLQLLDDPVKIVSKYLVNHDIALFAHCERDCVYQESATNILMNKAPVEDIRRQASRYRLEGYPEHNGMVETSILIRRHTPEVRVFNNCWWTEIIMETYRDQLSFNYAAWKMGMQYEAIGGNFRYGGAPWLKYYIRHGR